MILNILVGLICLILGAKFSAQINGVVDPLWAKVKAWLAQHG